jgi:hypothetical protein
MTFIQNFIPKMFFFLVPKYFGTLDCILPLFQIASEFLFRQLHLQLQLQLQLQIQLQLQLQLCSERKNMKDGYLKM